MIFSVQMLNAVSATIKRENEWKTHTKFSETKVVVVVCNNLKNGHYAPISPPIKPKGVAGLSVQNKGNVSVYCSSTISQGAT